MKLFCFINDNSEENLMGSGTFANKTFANRTFANVETPGGVLAKVRWTLPVVTKQYQYRIYVRAHVNVIGIGIS
jgi:hypothetical protein